MLLILNQQKKTTKLIAVLLLIGSAAFSQRDSLSLDDIPTERVLVKEAFNGPNIIYNQSTNMLQAKRLDFVLGHRFGKFSEGAFNAFGLDQSFVRMGFEYGIKDWLAVGIGRTSLGKNFDLFLKHRPLIQTTGGNKNIPVSMTVFLGSAFSSNELRRQNEIHKTNQFVNQLVYTFQTSVSRQFSTEFSAQLTGSMVHRNSVPSSLYSNDVYGVGVGGRLKLSGRMHLMAEYNHMFNAPDGIYDPVAIGIDIVAGGHVFNVHVANSVGIIEKDYLTATTDNISDGMRLGFTVRRSFMLKSKVEGGKVKY
jgi:hypothetical protein